MEVYPIEGGNYHEYNQLRNAHPSLKKGNRTRAAFIKAHSIPKASYTCARLEDGEWVISDGKSRKYDKFFIKVRFFKKMLAPKSVVYPDLPGKLALAENEMFYDSDGNVVEIDVRGKKTKNGVFFYGKDVSRGFDIKKLVAAIIDKDGSYQEGVDYRRFTYYPALEDGTTLQKDASMGNGTIRVYLTYKGIVKVLSNTRKASAKKFQSWMTNTLFVAQMGSVTQRRKLAGKILGLDAAAVDTMNKTTSGLIACVYFFVIGNAGNLRESMDISEEHDDNMLICKFGRTTDLGDRTKKHVKEYGKIDGADLQLVYRCDIDPKYLPKGEARVAHWMEDIGAMFSYQNYKELVIISESQLKRTKSTFDVIAEHYCGKVETLALHTKAKDYAMALLEANTSAAIAAANSDAKAAIIKAETETRIIKQRAKLALSRKDTEIVRKDTEIACLKAQLLQRT